MSGNVLYRVNIADLLYVYKIRYTKKYTEELNLMCRAFKDMYGLYPHEVFKILEHLKKTNPKAIRFKVRGNGSDENIKKR